MSHQPSEKHLEQASDLWNLNPNLKFHRRVENFIYFSSSDQGEVVLRLTEPTRRKKEELQAELDWQIWLSSRGVTCARPFESSRGELVEVIEDGGAIYFASVFEKLNGIQIRTPEQFTPELMKSWGRQLASLHTVTAEYRPSAKIAPRWNWREDFDRMIGPISLHDRRSLAGEQAHSLFEWLSKLPVDEKVYGLVHTDLHNGNFLVDGENELRIFDFDDCCYHWFGYDLAVPLFYLRFRNIDMKMGLDIKNLEGFYLQGYREIQTLDDDWTSRIESFIRLRALIMYFWCLKRLKEKDLDVHLADWCQKYLSWCETEFRNPLMLS